LIIAIYTVTENGTTAVCSIELRRKCRTIDVASGKDVDAGSTKRKEWLYSREKYVLRPWRNENSIRLLTRWGGSKATGHLEGETSSFSTKCNGSPGVISELWIELCSPVKKHSAALLR